MKLFKSAIIAVLVLFGLGMTVDLDAQTQFKDRYQAVDDLGEELNSLPSKVGQYDPQEIAAVQRAYPALIGYIDDEEDTEAGWNAFEADAEAEYNRKGGGFDNEYNRLREHLLSIITE